MRPNHYKTILHKLFKDGSSTEENRKLSETPEVSGYLEKIWNLCPAEMNDGEKHRKSIWTKITARCWGNTHKKRLLTATPRLQKLAYAAACIALLVAGTWIYHLSTPECIRLYAPKGQTVRQVLPDSTIVWLNSETSVIYYSNFLNKPIIHLEGEAFFDVKKRSHNTLKVLFNDACVEVKGTTFNIKAYKESICQVTLVNGEVEFSSSKLERNYTMSPSEQIIYNPLEGSVVRDTGVNTDIDWRTGIYKFKDKKLGELIEDINRIYNVNIVIRHDSYKNYLFNGTIRRGENLDDVMNKICFTLNLKAENTGDNIILY